MREPDAVLDRILLSTGCLPHLLQHYGQELALTVLSEGRTAISLQDVKNLEGRPQTAQFFIGIVNDVEDPVARLTALVALQTGARAVTVQGLQSRTGRP